MAVRRDQNDLLKGLKCPVSIFAGREDTLILSSEAEAMAAVIPGSRLKIFEKAGHLIPIEAPEEFQKCLEEFLDS
jgi:pimeloyl-ACP methyl ester carboxylesterase